MNNELFEKFVILRRGIKYYMTEKGILESENEELKHKLEESEFKIEKLRKKNWVTANEKLRKVNDKLKEQNETQKNLITELRERIRILNK